MGRGMKPTVHTIISILLALSLVRTAGAAPKATEAALVNFKNRFAVAVAVEEFEKPLRLLFFGRHNEVLYSTQFNPEEPTFGEFAYTNSFLRFRILDIKGLLSPMVLAIAAYPGGSDCGFEVKLIAERKGKIAELNPEPIVLNIEDGVYLGYISGKYGYGMMTWKFKWGDEAHLAPHRYEIRIYKWDSGKQAFFHARTITTRNKYTDGRVALKRYGLPSKNFRDVVIRPEEEISTLGMEDKMLQQNEGGD
jgi:hypothetical protein